MSDLLAATAEPIIETQEESTFCTGIPDRAVIMDQPPKWFSGLSPDHRQDVQWVPVAELKVHPACDFLPFSTLAAVTSSMKKINGVLFPLARAKNDGVIDGRYRLHGAIELGLEKLPILTIDVEGNAVIDWIFEVKDCREHLSEHERAVLAVQYQRRLKGKHIKTRSVKMSAARTGRTSEKRYTALPKLDSRKEACEKYKVRERTFRAVKRLADDRPDLYKKVVAGTLDAATALKKKGKNKENARVEQAKVLNAQPITLKSPDLENNIHCGDAVEIMKKVPDGAASLVLYSPPYPGVPVEYDPPLPAQTYAEYLAYQATLLAESFRVSRRGGRLAIVLDNVRNHENDRHFLLPVVADITRLAIDCGWGFLNEIAWCKDEISGSKTNFGSLGLCSAPVINRNHESILLCYKETHKLDGDNTLCDLSSKEYLNWWASTWHIKPEVDRERRRLHPAPFPEEIPYRLIKLLTYGRDLVIDPYNGSGTTTAVAKQLGRRYIGIDQSNGYCDVAIQRIGNSSVVCC